MHSSALALIFGTLAFTAVPQRLTAQGESTNAVYAELLGSGGVFSVNYERRLNALRLRVGFGSWTTDDDFGAGETSIATIPVTLSHVRGGGKHHLETGGGLTFGNREFTSSFDGTSQKSGFVTLTGLAGYRYQKPGSGFVFRALFTPLIGFGAGEAAYPDRGFIPSVGISLGAAF